MVAGGNKKEIPLLDWITIRFTINTLNAYHDFGVEMNLPIDMPIGGEFLRSDDCQIMYQASGRDAFRIMNVNCNASVRNKVKMKVEHHPQLQATPKRTPAKRRDLSCVVVPKGLPD